jgi:tRNA A37 threonylcarbamoyladenosine synthetase subunit TsaC/SUA5/YrdC
VFLNNNIALEIVKLLGNPIVSTSIHDDDEVLEYSTDPRIDFREMAKPSRFGYRWWLWR